MLPFFNYRLPFLLIFIGSNCIVYSQWRIPTDSVYELIKKNSVYKNDDNWSSIDLKYENCTRMASGNNDVIHCMITVFELLHDYSSSITYQNKVYSNLAIESQDSLKPSGALILQSEIEQEKIKLRLLKDKYVYIQLPRLLIPDNQINKFAQAISDSLNVYLNSKVKGLILDLRLNTGGQLASMLAGLHSILGDDKIGGEMNEEMKLSRTWKIESGNFYKGEDKLTDIKVTGTSFDQLPVAVLIGKLTHDEGSMTAIAFKYRNKTYFIGESAAEGLTIAKSHYKIHDDLTIDLATSYISDRKGHVYPHFIPTDIQVLGGDDFSDLSKDHKIITAIRWLDRLMIKNTLPTSK